MLTQEAVPFIWSDAQDQAFNKAKQLIASAPVLAYYDLCQRLCSRWSSSSTQQQRLSAASCFHLFQHESHRTTLLTNEKECLAICHTLQKFDH